MLIIANNIFIYLHPLHRNITILMLKKFLLSPCLVLFFFFSFYFVITNMIFEFPTGSSKDTHENKLTNKIHV